MYLNFQFCVMALNKTLYYDNIQTIFVKADPFIPHNMSDHIWNAETVNMTIHNTDTRKSLFCASISPDMTISPSLLACFYIFVYIRIKFKDWKSYSVMGCHKLSNYCATILPTQKTSLFKWKINKNIMDTILYTLLCQDIHLENKNKNFRKTKHCNKHTILLPLFIRPPFNFLSTLYQYRKYVSTSQLLYTLPINSLRVCHHL